MHRRTASVGKIVAILALIAAPVAIHAAIITSSWTPLILAVPLLQLIILGVAAGARHPARIKWLVAAAALLAAAVIWAQEHGLSLNAMPGIPHALAYAALLAGFGVSLLPGHVPILTRVVVSVRGPLPRGLMIHTRRVTEAWCVFFAAQLVISLGLYIWAPLEVWSFFVNVLNIPLVLLMFGIEYAYRVYRFRDYPHDSFADMLRIIAKTAEKRARQTNSS
jgi:uncharacterized membrane protein